MVDFEERLLAVADGNIGYLDAIGRGVDQTRREPAQREALEELLMLERMPPRLYELQRFFLQQVRSRQGSLSIALTDNTMGTMVMAEAWVSRTDRC